MKICKLLGFVITVVHIIPNGRAVNPSLIDTADSTLAKHENFIEVMLQRLGIKHDAPLNTEEIYATLDYSQQRIEVITDLIVSQHPSTSSDNLLSLLTTIHDVFEAIGESTNILEGSLNGIVSCVDLAVLDVQIALQVLIETFTSNCDILISSEQRSDVAIVSASYSLSSAIKNLIMTVSESADKIINSTEIFNGHTLTAIQAIVQTVVCIVDRVVRTLKYINVLELNIMGPNFDKLATVINRLANQRLNLIPKMSDEIVAPISEFVDSLRSNIQEIPKARDETIEHLVDSLKGIQDAVPEKQLIPIVISLLNELEPNLSSLSNAIHSIHGITDSVIYSTDVSLQNVIAITKCLSYYISILTKLLPTPNLIDLGSLGIDLQSILCLIASNIETLIETVTLAVERALMDLICTSPNIDKMVLDRQLVELQVLIEPVLLTFETIIKTSIQIVQNLLSVASCTLGDIFDANLMEDTNRFIRNLGRIINGMEAAVSSQQLLSETLPLDESETTTNENILSVCMRSFEDVAHSAFKVRFYFIKSIENIRKFIGELDN